MVEPLRWAAKVTGNENSTGGLDGQIQDPPTRELGGDGGRCTAWSNAAIRFPDESNRTKFRNAIFPSGRSCRQRRRRTVPQQNYFLNLIKNSDF